MTKMSSDEKQQFLADLHVGVLSVQRPDRAPLTVPVWYDYEPGGDVWFITGQQSVKAKYIETGTQISLCAQQEALPYVYVTAEGPVTAIEPASNESEPMAVRYLGEELGKQYAANSGGGDSVVIRMTPQRWLGVDYGKTI
jgi:PPOX class probable F420-dependent enzyme